MGETEGLRDISVIIPGLKHPLRIRVGTSDHWVMQQVLDRNEYEFPSDFSPSTILDAGANIGITSVLFANRFPSAKILALEPEPSNYEMLTKNIHPYPGITAVQGALWGHSGSLQISSVRRDEYWARA